MNRMKAVSLIVGSMLCAAICFGAGALTAATRHWLAPIVHVSIRNDSGEDLVKVAVVHASGGAVTTVTLPGLKHAQSTAVRFYVADPSGYRIEATFPDGRVVKGGSGYVEAGYATSEVIGKAAITGTPGLHY